MEEEQINYKKIIKNLKKNKFYIISKLKIKTNALWFASEIIQSKLQPEKTVEQVYESLKFIGKQQIGDKGFEKLKEEIKKEFDKITLQD